MTNNAFLSKKKTSSHINAFWLIAEKLISTLGLFLISTFVAQYIGPAMVGVIALAVASFQIVHVVAQFGSENIIIRRLSRNLHSGIALAKVSMAMRALIYFTITIPILWFSHSKSYIDFMFCTAVAIATFFTTIDLIATYNDTTLNSRVNTSFNLCGLVIALLIRYFIVELKLNILWLTLPIVITTGLPFTLRIAHFARYSFAYHGKKQGKATVYLNYLFLTGCSMFIANVSVAIYPRINFFFLSQFSDAEILGIYSVAVTLASAWNFILLAVITSYFPSIYNEKDEYCVILKISKLNIFIIFISLCVILGFAIVGEFFISSLYGPVFTSAYIPTLILCAGTMLSTLGTVSSRFILKYSGYRYLSYKSLLTLILCVPLSWYSINAYGLTGASLSVVLLELISLTLLNYAYQRGKVIKMHLFIFTWLLMSVQKRPQIKKEH